MRPPRPPTSPSATLPPRVSVEGSGASDDAQPPELAPTPASESGASVPVKFDVGHGHSHSNSNTSPRKRRLTKKKKKYNRKKSVGGGSKQGRNRPPTALERKAEEIEAVLAADEVDLWRLRELALTEDGLVNDSIRKRAWPKLVGIHNEGTVLDAIGGGGDASAETIAGTANSSDAMTATEATIAVIDPVNLDSAKARRGVVARCLDAEQIDRDIARCTWHLLTGSQRQRRRNMAKIEKHSQRMESLLKKKQRRLGNLINLVLVQSYDFPSNENDADDDDRLRYYQGYHDVSCIFLNVLGGASIAAGAPGNISAEMASKLKGSSRSVDQAALAASAMGLDLPSSVLLQISRSHFRDAMKSDFQSLSAALRLIMMPLIAALDKEVHAKLWEVDMEPFFAISWIITWFSHDVRDTDVVKRLFDCFLVSHPLMPVYMAVAMLLHPVNRMEIIHAESEFSAVHNAITHLPRNSCSVGWRYQGGIDGGYVSDDGDGPDEDETTLGSSTMGEASFFSDDFSSSGPANDMEAEDDASMAMSQAPSMASASIYSARAPPRVPFESLIDLSLSYM